MGQVYVLVSNWCFLDEGLCLRTGRAGEERRAKGWAQSLLPPRRHARVVSLGGFRQEKRTRTDQLPSPIFLDPSAGDGRHVAWRQG